MKKICAVNFFELNEGALKQFELTHSLCLLGFALSSILVRLTDRLTDRNKDGKKEKRNKERQTDRQTEDRIFFVVPRDAYRIANHNCSAETTTR